MVELSFKLVSVYEVLRDHERRKQYDLVLENGLPDWRMPVYYYRKVRKMGLLEMSLLLLVILTVGHWLVIWSIYYERKYELVGKQHRSGSTSYFDEKTILLSTLMLLQIW